MNYFPKKLHHRYWTGLKYGSMVVIEFLHFGFLVLAKFKSVPIQLFSQESSIVDVRLSSKYTSTVVIEFLLYFWFLVLASSKVFLFTHEAVLGVISFFTLQSYQVVDRTISCSSLYFGPSLQFTSLVVMGILKLSINHFFPPYCLSSLLKTFKNQRFCDIFRGVKGEHWEDMSENMNITPADTKT